GGLSRHFVERPILRLQRPRLPTLYGAFFGAAEVVEGIELCRKRFYPLNLPNTLAHGATLALMFLRTLFRRGGGRMKVVDERGQEEDGRFFLIGVTALDELLFGLKPAPGESDRRDLHYLSVRKGFAAILKVLPDLFQRRISPGEG